MSRTRSVRHCLWLLVLFLSTVDGHAAPTVLVLSPTRQTLVPGQSTSLSVSATGTGTLSYQWTHNGRPLAGATGGVLPLTNVTARDTGYYLATVTDATGTERSAALFVAVAPLHTQVGFGPVDDIITVARSGYNGLALKRGGTVVAKENPNFPYGQGSVPAGLDNVVGVAGSLFHSLALKADGTVVTWGGNQFGPYKIPADLNDVVAIFAGEGNGSFAIKRDGTLVRWGSAGFYGYVPPGLANVIDVAGDGEVFLALQADGQIVPFGRTNHYGIDSPPSGLTDLVAVTIAGNFAVALRANGTIVTWGDGAAQLPDISNLPTVVSINGLYVLLADGTVVSLTSGLPYPDVNSVFSLPGFLRDATYDTAPAITVQPVGTTVVEDQSVVLTVVATGPQRLLYQWRKNGVNIVGATAPTLTFPKVLPADAGSYDVVVSNHIGSTASSAAVVSVNPLAVISSQSDGRHVLLPGQNLALAVTATGTGGLSYQWTRNNRPIPGAVNNSLLLSNVTVGDSGAYVLRITDSFGTRRSQPMFVTVAPALTQVCTWAITVPSQAMVPDGLNDAIALSSSVESLTVLALKRDGTLTGWGVGADKQLNFPSAQSGVVAIAQTQHYALALQASGRLQVWGGLGPGYEYEDAKVYQLTVLTDIIAVTASALSAVALRSDGTLWPAGYYRALENFPSGITDAVAIASARFHSLALRANGTVVAWGSNEYGESTVPAGLSDVVSIAAGRYLSLALKADGTVVAWGQEAGNIPAGLTDVVSISSTLALKADGTAVAFGGVTPPPADLANVFSVSTGDFPFALRDASNEGPPVIVTQPSGATLAYGRPANLVAAVAGVQPLALQWKKDGVAIPGANNASHVISSFTANDAGSYTLMATNSEGSVISDAAVLVVLPPSSDFNGDARPDVLWQNMVTGERRLWLMDGTSKASEVSLGSAGLDWQMAGSADFNGDGYNDIVWQNTATGERAVWLMNGTDVAAHASLGTVDPVWNIAVVADFDQDRRPDLLWENTLTGERGIWLMNGVDLADYADLGIQGIQWNAAGAGDFNGDDMPDIVWQNSLTGERKVWLMNDTAKSSEVSLGFVALQWVIGAVADYNGDGSADVFWQDTATGEHAIWLMNGTTIAGYVFPANDSTDWVVGRIPRRPAASDFNRDGKPDIVWQNTTTGDRSVWLMNGSAFSSEVPLSNVPPSWQIAGTGDLDNDGRCDVVWQNIVTGERGVWLMNGTNLAGYFSLGTVSLNWQIMGTGDFNADNRTDVLWQNTSTGERGVWLMNGTELSGYASLGVVPLNWQIAGVGDFNRDDKPDIIWQNSVTGDRKVWLMNGTTFGSEVSLGNVALAWQIVGLADYNLDGQVDIIWQNISTGESGIWLMNGTTLSGYVSLGVRSTNWKIAN